MLKTLLLYVGCQVLQVSSSRKPHPGHVQPGPYVPGGNWGKERHKQDPSSDGDSCSTGSRSGIAQRG